MKVPHQISPNTRPSSQGLAYFSSEGATPEAFGAGIGRGLQGLASGFAQREATLKAEAEKRKARAEQTDRFTTLTNFSAFESDVNERLTELKRNADPTGKGFKELAETAYAEAEAEFLARDVTPELREEFTYRASQVKQRIVGDALNFEYQAGDAYFRTGISQEYEKAKRGLDPALGGDPSQLTVWEERLYEAIDVSDLPDISESAEKLGKADLKRQISIGLAGIGYKAVVKEAQAAGAINLPETVGAVIDDAANRYGVDPKAMRMIAWLESRGNPNARNPNSSAGGLFQQIDANAKQYGVENKFDAAQSAEGAARFAAENTRFLESKLGRSISAGELYLAHQQGPQGALRLLSNPDRLAVDIVGYDAVRLNGGAPGMTAGQFARLWIKKAERADPDIEGNPAFAVLPYEDRIALRADAEREFLDEVALEVKRQKEVYTTQLNTLLVGVNDGRAGAVDLANARDSWLTEYDDIKKVEDLLERKTKEAKLSGMVTSMLASPYAVADPTNEDFKNGFNLWVGDEGLERLTKTDEGYVTNTLVPSVTKLGDIPTDVVGHFTGMIRSNVPQQSLFALDSLRQLEEADYRAYEARVPEDVKRDVEFYRQNMNMPVDKLLERMNGGDSTEERRNNSELRKEAQSILAAKEAGVTALSSMVSEVVADHGGWIKSAQVVGLPAFAMQLENDYQNHFVAGYEMFRDTKKADEYARKATNADWDVTSIGGRPTLMKHPPEKVGYKSLNGGHEWIDKQVRAEVGLAETDTFQLVSDDQTEREFKLWQLGQGPAASYQIVVFDSNGVAKLHNERRYFTPTPRDLEEDAKAWQRDDMFEKLTRAEARRMEAEKYYSSRGEPVPQEFLDESEQMLNKYEKLAPNVVPYMGNEPLPEPTPGSAM